MTFNISFEKARQRITALRALVDQNNGCTQNIARTAAEVSYHDQLGCAVAEAQRLFDVEGVTNVDITKVDIAARLIVALGRCWPCPHIANCAAPLPILAVLSKDQVFCVECYRERYDHYINMGTETSQQQQSPRCDWCMRESMSSTVPLNIREEYMMLQGSACPDCYGALNPK